MTLWSPAPCSFRIQQIPRRGNEQLSVLFSRSPFSLRSCSQSLQLQPTRHVSLPKPLLVTLSFNTAILPKKTTDMQPFALNPQSADAPRTNITTQVQLISLQLPFLYNLGSCRPDYFNSSLMSLNRFLKIHLYSLSSVTALICNKLLQDDYKQKSLMEFFHQNFNLLQRQKHVFIFYICVLI